MQTTEIPENIVDASIKDSAGETAANGGAATQTTVDTDVGGESTGGNNQSWLAQTWDSVKKAVFG